MADRPTSLEMVSWPLEQPPCECGREGEHLHTERFWRWRDEMLWPPDFRPHEKAVSDA